MLYSTDASIFELVPQQVVTPQAQQDLIDAVVQALEQKQPLTMRAGGTSLGGQAIGSGCLIDISKHLTQVIEYQPDQRCIWVEPGVIQDDLNAYVSGEGLGFAPDTSTSNRAMIGGMIGNNSCGSYSVFYGTTREHVEALDVILSDGSLVRLEPLEASQLQQKLVLNSLEGQIYRDVMALLQSHRELILAASAHESVVRRNTGYALDVLLRDYQPFNPQGRPFNLAPLICGSEGTLCVIRAAKLKLVSRPRQRQLLCAHFNDIDAALSLVPDLLTFNPAAVELIDKATLEGTLHNLEQEQNRFWIEQDPQAVLVIELFDEDEAQLQARSEALQSWLLARQAYAVPKVAAQQAGRVWALRKAGLGLLMGKRSRKKAIAGIEDAAVPVAHLADFYRDVRELMARLKVSAVYYGHASVGLIHIRPELDLSDLADRETYLTLAQDFAGLVKKYQGALSGEHGDGRIRAPYLRAQVGGELYGIWEQLKASFDPLNLFNPGVILADTPIDQNLRASRQPHKHLTTGFSWRADLSLVDAVEKCNGAGACRKSKGLMCPSYQATRDEAYSTRGRASLLRFALTEPDPQQALHSEQLQQALELCLGCKACKTECPASVDMARLKSEVWYQTRPSKKQAWLLTHQQRLLHWAARWPKVSQWAQDLTLVKKFLGVDPRRRLPPIVAEPFINTTWESELEAASNRSSHSAQGRVVWVLFDLYSQYQEPQVGRAVWQSLSALGLEVRPIFMSASPRALISQGLLDEAKQVLTELCIRLKSLPPSDYVVGVEPSEVLVWRDEAKDLLPKYYHQVRELRVKLYEELLLDLQAQSLLPELKVPSRKLWLHVHCHQKSLARAEQVSELFNSVQGLNVQEVQAGCCGMSGAFGYQHYELSIKIAQRGILPALESAETEDWVVATGVSCRSQIGSLTDHKPLHVAQVFNQILNPS